MAREIKFRGSNGDGTWYIGDYITDNREFNRTCDKAFILPRWDKLNCPISVEPKSVGQYTGLKDKNGREIYDGDILKCRCLDKKKWHLDTFDPLDETKYFYRNSVIEWWQSHCNLGYRLRDGKGKTFMIKPSSLQAMDVEIIGNIYENPELLEVRDGKGES